jgi:lysophospholipase L1-like esterase
MPFAAAIMGLTLACTSPGAMHADLTGREANTNTGDFLYSFAVPEGNWRVTVVLGSPDHAATTSIKAESRRLMARAVTTNAGETRRISFLVPVRRPVLAAPPENAPGGRAVQVDPREAASQDWDDRLTLEFLGHGSAPQVAEICVEPAESPVIYLAGDSTVANQPAEPAASWGQMLPALFDDRIAVANHAKSGATLKSFIADLRLAKVLSGIKAGDYLLIQFGHNDQKAQWPQTYADPQHAYPAYLRAFIAEARARGAHPVLVTSPERRNFDDGHIRDTLGEYADAVRRVAAEEGVPLVDLNRDSITLYEAMGEERAAGAFNDEGRDRTHHNNYGAWLLARSVAQQLAQAIPALAAHMVAGPFDPAHPPAADTLQLAPSIAHDDTRPQGS